MIINTQKAGLLLLFSFFSILAYSQNFSDLSHIAKKDLFVEKTEKRVKDLELSIRTVGNKSIERSIREEAVNAAVQYFATSDKVFEVSSLNRSDISREPVRKYLSRLMILPYRRVEIKWVKTQWVSKFRQAPDGKYYGTVRIIQAFKGYGGDNRLQYEDLTTKDIEVVIEVVKMDLGGSSREVVMVYLGDVRVVETRKN